MQQETLIEENIGNSNEKEAIELIEKVRDRIRTTNSQFYEIVKDLRIIRDKKYYALVKNTKTNEPFSNFEEFCLFYYELSRTTVFNYMQALEYLEKHHPECVHACEPIEHRKINLLATLDNDKFQNERIELDSKVFNQKISYRDLEEEIKQLKEKSFEIDLKKVQAFDKNIYYLSDTYEEYGDKKILCVEKYNDKIRVHYDSFSTLTTQSLLFHIDGREFSLREYAGVQDFPEDFKLVGNYSEIKKQLGNAVDVKMAEAVVKKFIKGNSYIELFCGCGGFSQGAHNLGKNCLWAIDRDKYAGYSFKLNFPETDVCITDIKKIDEKEIYEKIGKVDFIMGSPPCQGFSLAGNKFGFECDERNDLYLEMIRFLKIFKPSQFVMENVPPILEYKDRIIKDFGSAGYDVEVEKINGLEIGSKQSRTRVFFIGNRREK